MSPEDIQYLACLVAGIPLAFFFRMFSEPSSKRLFSTVVGLTIAGLVCRYLIVYSLLLCVVSYLIIALCGSYRGGLTFAWAFSYLLFCRTADKFGFEIPAGHANAVQLIMTLRVVSVAFEITDIEKEKKERKGEKVQYNTFPGGLCDVPTAWDYFSYCYCFCGAMTGPYFSYKLYNAMVNNRRSSEMHTSVQSFKRQAQLIPVVIAYLLVEKFLPLNYIFTEDFSQLNILAKFGYMIVHTIKYRQRFYIAWLLSESVCISAGFGANMPGCTDPLEQDIKPIININIPQVEFADSLQMLVRNWNMSVQKWLLVYVYKRVPGPKIVRTISTLLVSSFWHGVKPGYYLFFLCVPVFQLVETRYMSIVVPLLTPKRHDLTDDSPLKNKIRHFFGNMYTMMSFSFIGPAFYVLEIQEIFDIWALLDYYGFVFMGILLVLSIPLPSKRSVWNQQKKDEKKSN
eukprot:Nk52_evm30s210 gene=Nk52_evmTU30s210